MAAKKIKIKLNRVYRGTKTKEIPIQPGVYEDGDDALLEVPADYLIYIGVAELVEDPAEKSSSKASAKKDDTADDKKSSK